MEKIRMADTDAHSRLSFHLSSAGAPSVEQNQHYVLQRMSCSSCFVEKRTQLAPALSSLSLFLLFSFCVSLRPSFFQTQCPSAAKGLDRISRRRRRKKRSNWDVSQLTPTTIRLVKKTVTYHAGGAATTLAAGRPGNYRG